MGIKLLQLIDYRNHKELSINCNSDNVLIYGSNGAGKTNILEAISLLAPGKGIFNAPGVEILNSTTNSNAWQIFCEVIENGELNKIGTGFNNFLNKRTIKLNETPLKRTTELLEVLRIIWLTPQMDGILSGSSGEKRKFFDRIVYNFYPSHANSVSRYEYALKSRSKLLAENYADIILLNNFEKILAEECIKILNTRFETIKLISKQFTTFKTTFLHPSISIKGSLEKDIANLEQSEQYDHIISTLSKNRKIDTYSKRTNYGIHRSEISFLNRNKNITASMCSTGEKKAMLISLIIGQIKALRNIFDGSIILLMDDIFSHLDNNYRSKLIEELEFIKAQIWITSTHNDELHCNNFVKVGV